jgi:hypothetical protein
MMCHACQRKEPSGRRRQKAESWSTSDVNAGACLGNEAAAPRVEERNPEPKLRGSGEMHAMAVEDGTSGGRTNHERRGVVTLHKL